MIRRLKRGSLLLEAIFAIFLLLIGVVLFGSMFSRSARLSTNQTILNEQIALAENTLTDIKVWAETPANYDSNWGTWNGTSVAHPLNSGIVATVRCLGTGRALESPSSELERNWDPALVKVIDKAVVPVEITVVSGGIPDFTLLTQIAPPVRPLPATPRLNVVRTSGTEPISPGATATYSAQVDGVSVPGLVVEWFLIPRTGNASLLLNTSPRTGQNMGVKNEFKLPGGYTAQASGEIILRARARYHGTIIENGDPADKVVQVL